MTAGGGNVVAFLAAQGCDHTVLPQDRIEIFPAAREAATIPGVRRCCME